MRRVDLPGATGLFTDRHGGVSDGPYESLNLGLWTEDDDANLVENRRRVAEMTGAPTLAQGHQVHGTSVRRVHDTTPLTFDDDDGQATARADVALMVLVADCVPVLLAAHGAVAAIHAGWKGLAGGIIGEGVVALGELGGEGELHAAIGPHARACCYEVGPEVGEQFGEHYRDRMLDLTAIATDQLRDAGVAEILDTERCTICDDSFFSHRRDGGITGRQAGVIWRS